MSNIRTVAHAYQFNTNKADELAAFKALHAKLSAMGLKCFESHGGALHIATGRKIDGLTIELETAHVFDNQWNTAPIDGVTDKGLRVMDWAQDFRPSNSLTLKQGYWLEPTPEMAEVRRNTYACGYCGKQEPAAKGDVFCPHCIGSEHLDRATLHLTRMRPVASKADRAELTEAEAEHLVPIWTKAKIHGHTARDKAARAKERADLDARYLKSKADAETEYRGFTWLLDHGVRKSMAIFYTHTGRFGFGWSRPVPAEVLAELLEIISEFPFPYDIKCADGRTLSGN